MSAKDAGASARREFERRAARHRERIDASRTRALVGCAAFVVVGLIVALGPPFVPSPYGPLQPLLGWLLIALAIGQTVNVLFVMPNNVRAWQTGGEGEEVTARALEPLGELGFVVLHDRQVPGSRANLDHIVIGPPGVFAVETKRYGGTLRVRGGEVRVNGRRVGAVDQAIREAAAVQRVLAAELAPLGASVVPVVCVHRAYLPWFGAETNGVRILSGRELARYLKKQPVRLSLADVDWLASLADVRLARMVRTAAETR